MHLHLVDIHILHHIHRHTILLEHIHTNHLLKRTSLFFRKEAASLFEQGWINDKRLHGFDVRSIATVLVLLVGLDVFKAEGAVAKVKGYFDVVYTILSIYSTKVISYHILQLLFLAHLP